MWVLTTFFALSTLTVIWLCAAYFVVLRFVSFLKPRRTAPAPDVWPRLSVVVPCYNESEMILGKLQNLLAIDYPIEKLEIVFVDGGSTDGTYDLLVSAVPAEGPVRVVRSPRKGKIHQLNHALSMLDGDIIVVSDVDGDMERDTLRHLVAEFALDGRVAVVGAYNRASGAIWRDRCFWDSQNRGRLIESDAWSSSIVIATCYAFKHGLFDRYPDDAVADDVYVGFLANSLGHRVVYSRQAMVNERRAPSGISEFLSHKFRKNNAFLRESLRFLYRLPEMTGACKMMMLTRIAQQLLLPCALSIWSLLALTLLTLGRLDLFIMSAAFVALSLMIARQAFQSVDVPDVSRERFGLLKYGTVFFETMCVLFAAALSYAFYRQDSCYSRLGTASSSGDDDPSEAASTPLEVRSAPRRPLMPAVTGLSPKQATVRGLEELTAGTLRPST